MGKIEKIGDIIKKGDFGPSKYIKHEFQDYGYRLAVELNDLEHRSLYMKLAKEEDCAILEQARGFVKEAAPNLKGKKSKAKLFMWKLKQLREEKKTGKIKKEVRP